MAKNKFNAPDFNDTDYCNMIARFHQFMDENKGFDDEIGMMFLLIEKLREYHKPTCPPRITYNRTQNIRALAKYLDAFVVGYTAYPVKGFDTNDYFDFAKGFARKLYELIEPDHDCEWVRDGMYSECKVCGKRMRTTMISRKGW